MGRRRKVTAEEGLKLIAERDPLTETYMTRLQNRMSVREASRFRRLVRERAKQWRTTAEHCLTRSMRKKGARRKVQAKELGHEGRQAYTVIDATGPVVLNERQGIHPVMHRYPNGRVYLDLRLWGYYMDEEMNLAIIPTRKGIALPFDQVGGLIARLRVLWKHWENRVLTPEQKAERDLRRKEAKKHRNLQKRVQRLVDGHKSKTSKSEGRSGETNDSVR